MRPALGNGSSASSDCGYNSPKWPHRPDGKFTPVSGHHSAILLLVRLQLCQRVLGSKFSRPKPDASSEAFRIIAQPGPALYGRLIRVDIAVTSLNTNHRVVSDLVWRGLVDSETVRHLSRIGRREGYD